MKSYRTFLGAVFISLLGSCSTSHYETPFDIEDVMNPNAPQSLKIYPIDKKKFIQGICFIHLNSEVLHHYCNDVKLVLRDLKGNVIRKVKVDNIGNFSFSGLEMKTYQIEVESDIYRTLADKIYANPGSELLIHLIPSKG